MSISSEAQFGNTKYMFPNGEPQSHLISTLDDSILDSIRIDISSPSPSVVTSKSLPGYLRYVCVIFCEEISQKVSGKFMGMMFSHTPTQVRFTLFTIIYSIPVLRPWLYRCYCAVVGWVLILRCFFAVLKMQTKWLAVIYYVHLSIYCIHLFVYRSYPLIYLISYLSTIQLSIYLFISMTLLHTTYLCNRWVNYHDDSMTRDDISLLSRYLRSDNLFGTWWGAVQHF